MATQERCPSQPSAGLKNCVRIKLDMSAANKALRDPVAFRCNLTHHWRTGHTYKVGRAWRTHEAHVQGGAGQGVLRGFTAGGWGQPGASQVVPPPGGAACRNLAWDRCRRLPGT